VKRIAGGVGITTEDEQSQYLVDVIAVVVADGGRMSSANELHEIRQLSLAHLKLICNDCEYKLSPDVREKVYLKVAEYEKLNKSNFF